MELTQEDWDGLVHRVAELERKMAVGFRALALRFDQLDNLVIHLHARMDDITPKEGK